MAAHFYLHRRGRGDQHPVTVLLAVLRGQTQVKIATPVRVRPAHWSKRRERLRPSAPGATELNAALDELKAAAEACALRYPKSEDLKAALLERLGRATEKPEPRLLELFEAFLEEKRTRTTANTIKSYATLKKHLGKWLPSGFRPSEVGPAFLDDFVSFLLGEGLANRSVNKLAGYIKGFLRWLHRRELLGAVPDTAKLPTIRKAVVYLKPDELHQFKTADLSDLPAGHEDARTLFLFQAYTGQRFSDLGRLRWEHLSQDRQFWHLTTQKTGLISRVPLPTPARAILEARAGMKMPLPKLSNQNCNVYLKTICERAKITERVHLSRQRGGVREQETSPKWKLIGTHAARRTYISLFLQEGGPMTDLLGLTHDDLRMVRPYAGVDDEKRWKHVERVFGEM